MDEVYPRGFVNIKTDPMIQTKWIQLMPPILA